MFQENIQTQIITPNWKQKYYPWIICFSGLLILIVINGLTTTSLSVFDNAFLSEFHWTREELKLRESVTNSITLLFIFISGLIIDKIRVKKMLLFGTFTLAFTLLGYSFVQNKYQAYFAHFFLGIAMITAGSVACIILVSSWFNEKKGLALGIVLVGTSLGSAIFSPLNMHLLCNYGWREAFKILSIFPAILFVYIYFFVHNSPANIGIFALGNPSKNNNIPDSDLLNQGMSYKEASKTHLFWLICICGFCTFYSLVGTIANTFLHVVESGYTEHNASYFLTIYFLVAGLSKLVVSIFSDYINPYLVFTVCCLIMIVGLLGFGTMNTSFILPSILLLAISWGGIYSLYNLIAVKTFGLKEAGKINGTISMFEGGGSFLGPFLTAKIYNLENSYQVPFLINASLMIFVFFISIKFRAYVNKINS
ncbi:nitrate/nitrite transporter NarK [Arcicella aurantiaca]|uniref:Nitrate/nitrite transporter NarK n=1 Tax=Arcicella aurantiaca TaxID=591202 RepID=A0A316E735_9BACT|nr:MFS transporter [Arcicella aurantiaca]PWK25179.1 nitrate/nitrite transporter NarK [Arcicella aurantiaca]